MLPLFVLPWIALATPTAPPMAAGTDCADAARAELQVAGGYDAVRVVTAPGAPGASVVVSVAGADRWTSLTARAGGPTSLSLAPGADGPVLVAVEPDLDAVVGACVQRVELLRGGEVIARLDLVPAAAAVDLAPAAAAGSW
ncbi:MAG: hypothetical protein IPL61_04290 [Myxococcales bacterium]|nr:hypothetical protein [Myxococcales bacterium]